MKIQNPHIGRNIACIRAIKGIKQSTLAKELGVSQQAVSKMEQCAEIGKSKLFHISLILNVSIDYIVNFSEHILNTAS